METISENPLINNNEEFAQLPNGHESASQENKIIEPPSIMKRLL